MSQESARHHVRPAEDIARRLEALRRHRQDQLRWLATLPHDSNMFADGVAAAASLTTQIDELRWVLQEAELYRGGVHGGSVEGEDIRAPQEEGR